MNKNNTAPLESAAAAQAAVPAELAKLAVLDLPSAIMNIPCRRADDTFLNQASRLLYKEGHRDARHDAADLVLERADELAALAAPAVPSPPLSAPEVPVNKDVEWLMQCAEEAQSHPELAAKIRAACRASAKAEASPPLSEGLTDSRIRELQQAAPTITEFARAIEREVTARLSAPPSPTLHGAVGAEPVAWAFPDGLARLKRVRDGHADSPLLVVHAKDAGDYNVPLYATPVSTQFGAAAAPVDRNAVLEEAALAAEKLEDEYRRTQSFRYPEMRDDAETGAAACAEAIRALKSVSAPDGGDERKETGE